MVDYYREITIDIYIANIKFMITISNTAIILPNTPFYNIEHQWEIL